MSEEINIAYEKEIRESYNNKSKKGSDYFVDTEFKESVATKFDIYEFWEFYLKNTGTITLDIKKPSIYKTCAYLAMKFLPIEIFYQDDSSRKSGFSIDLNLYQKLKSYLKDNDEKKFVDLFYTEILKNNTNVRNLFKHPDSYYYNDKKNSNKKNWSTQGDKIRARYLDILNEDMALEIKRIVLSLKNMNIESAQVRELIENYFVSTDGYIACVDAFIEKSNKWQSEEISYIDIVKKKLLNSDDEKIFELLARLMICLLLGELALPRLKYFLALDESVRTIKDLRRLEIEEYFVQKDFRNLYMALEEIDDSIFTDCTKCQNAKSKDFYYAGFLYSIGEVESSDEENYEKVKELYFECLRKYDKKSGMESNYYLGEVLCWLIKTKLIDYNDDCILQFGKNKKEILEKCIKEYKCNEAASLLGMMYETGEDVKKNEKIAIDLYLQACNENATIGYINAVRVIKKLINENENNYNVYEKELKKAARSGVEEAILLVSENEVQQTKETEKKEYNNSLFIVVGNNEQNSYFKESLGKDSDVRSLDNPEKNDITEILQKESIYFGSKIFDKMNSSKIEDVFLKSEKIYFVALGSDQQSNLRYTLDFLEICLSRYLQLKKYIKCDLESVGEKQNSILLDYLMKNVFIATNVDKNESEIYIDRLQTMFENIVIPIRYCSYYEEASFDLLWNKAPLFTSKFGYNENEQKKVSNDIVVIENDENVIPIINNILSVLYYGDEEQTYQLSVIGPNADKIESYMRIYESSIFEKSDKVYDKVSQPVFITKDLNDWTIWDWDNKNNTVAKILMRADYIVCCTDDGLENVRIAQLIREKQVRFQTLVNNPKYNDLGIIACLCGKSKLTEKTRGFFMNDDYVKYPWYSNYNLIGFGNQKDIYSFENLFLSTLEELSYKMHSSYCRDSETNVIDERKAKCSYYSSAYNMDSSKINAVYTIYQMFTANVFHGWKIWNEEWLRNIGKNDIEKFEKKISTELEIFSKKMHSQWVMFMKTRGFSRASVEQMKNYMSHGNAKHNSTKVAKLHPYMVQWEEIGDSKEKNREKYELYLENLKRDIEARCEKMPKESEIQRKMNLWITTEKIRKEIDSIFAGEQKEVLLEKNYKEFAEELYICCKKNDKNSTLDGGFHLYGIIKELCVVLHDKEDLKKIKKDIIMEQDNEVNENLTEKLEKIQQKLEKTLNDLMDKKDDIRKCVESIEREARTSQKTINILELEKFAKNTISSKNDKSYAYHLCRYFYEGIVKELHENYISVLKELISIISKVTEYDGEATKLQKEIDFVMLGLGMNVLTPIKEINNDMISSIPGLYRNLIKEIHEIER